MLLAAYFVIQPFSPLAPEPTLAGAHPWHTLIRHIRLLSLPITKKYLPESKAAVLPATEEDRQLAGRRPSRLLDSVMWLWVWVVVAVLVL